MVNTLLQGKMGVFIPNEDLKHLVPLFFNLKHLKIRFLKPKMSYTEIVVHLLSISAHLETLTITTSKPLIHYPHRIYLEFQSKNPVNLVGFPIQNSLNLPLDFLRPHLKEVEMTRFSGNKNDIQLVIFFSRR